MAKISKTGAGTHVATQRGYAGGLVIEPGEAVPADIVFSPHWMTEGKPQETPAAEEPVAA